MADDWPSFHDELTRKTTAELEKWTTHYDAGKLPKPVFRLIVSALYDTTSGLIHKDVSDLLADIERDLRA